MGYNAVDQLRYRIPYPYRDSTTKEATHEGATNRANENLESLPIYHLVYLEPRLSSLLGLAIILFQKGSARDFDNLSLIGRGRLGRTPSLLGSRRRAPGKTVIGGRSFGLDIELR